MKYYADLLLLALSLAVMLASILLRSIFFVQGSIVALKVNLQSLLVL